MAMIRSETEMKDSGIEYLGKIPTTWEKCRLKNVCTSFNSNITTSIINKEHGNYKIFGASGLIGYIEFETMQDEYLGIVKDGAGVGRIGSYPSHSSLLGTLAYIIPNDGINMNWLKYVIENMNLGESIDKTTIPHIYFSTYGNNYIPFPSSDEQQSIADYLDETCSKIDEIIAEAKASIDEYKTFKQALIAEITTNGLNKNIDFCETNFAWMGKIPSHWELKPFKYVLNERNEKNNPIKSTERLSLSIDKGITLYAEKTTNLDRFKDDFTAYKLAYKGDLVMNSMNMIVGASGVSDYFGCVSPVYYTYFDNEPDHITAKYCEYLFRSRMLMRVLRSLGRGIHHIDRGDDRVNTCRLKVSRDDLRTLVLPVPPLCEQRDIVSFLDKRTTEIDSLISEKESLINDLEAYKKSLIYEVVTGKRRVV